VRWLVGASGGAGLLVRVGGLGGCGGGDLLGESKGLLAEKRSWW
jgi:hypothetical protein